MLDKKSVTIEKTWAKLFGRFRKIFYPVTMTTIVFELDQNGLQDASAERFEGIRFMHMLFRTLLGTLFVTQSSLDEHSVQKQCGLFRKCRFHTSVWEEKEVVSRVILESPKLTVDISKRNFAATLMQNLSHRMSHNISALQVVSKCQEDAIHLHAACLFRM